MVYIGSRRTAWRRPRVPAHVGPQPSLFNTVLKKSRLAQVLTQNGDGWTIEQLDHGNLLSKRQRDLRLHANQQQWRPFLQMVDELLLSGHMASVCRRASL
jgi:hypothetical protein